MQDITLTDLLAVSKCKSDSTKLTQKLRQLIYQDHEVYQQEKRMEGIQEERKGEKRRTINSEMSVTSPIVTESEASQKKITIVDK